MSHVLDPRSAYEAALRNGSYLPASFFIHAGLSNFDFHYSSPQENRLVHHEYLHFVQHTTTSYGLNCFLREADIAALTISLVRQLAERHPEIRFPLEAMLPHVSVPEADEIRSTRALIEDIKCYLGFLQGACKFDPATSSTLFRGQPVAEGSCLFLKFDDPAMLDEYVALGARAVMEGAASTHESIYLTAAASGGHQAAAEALATWFATKEASPVYWVVNDLVRKFRPDDEDYRFALMALCDLALCVPVEWSLQEWHRAGASTQAPLRSPGRRFYDALEASQGIPGLEFGSYGADYRRFIGAVCQKLQWTPPWEIFGEDFNSKLMKAIGSVSLIYDYSGQEILFLNGQKLRVQYSSLCPIPLSLPSAEDFAKKRAEGKPAVVLLDSVLFAHPPPFLRINEGEYVFSDFARKAYSRYFVGDENFEKFGASFDHFTTLQQLTGFAWGDPPPESASCAFFRRRDSTSCSFVRGTSAAPAVCHCTQVLREIFGFAPDRIKWSVPV